MRCRGISLRNLQVRDAPLAHSLVPRWLITSCMIPTGRCSRHNPVHSVFSSSPLFTAPTSSHSNTCSDACPAPLTTAKFLCKIST